MQSTRKLLLLIALATFCGVDALACSCGRSGAVCGPLGRPASMFLGRILDVRGVDNLHTLPSGKQVTGGGRRIFTVEIVEDFRGRSDVGAHLEVETGMGGGDCGYTFHLNELYLLDVYDHDGIYSTGICSETAPAAQAAVVLRELRAAAAGTRLPDLIGNVVRLPTGAKRQWGIPLPVPQVPITIQGSDGSTVTSSTDAEGLYGVSNLTPGEYTVHFQLPSSLTTLNGSAEPLKVTIPETNGTGAACHASLYVFPPGRLTGKVVDMQGNFGLHLGRGPTPGDRQTGFRGHLGNGLGERAV